MTNIIMTALVMIIIYLPGLLLLLAGVCLGTLMLRRYFVRRKRLSVRVEAELCAFMANEQYDEYGHTAGYNYKPLYRYVYEGVTYIPKPHGASVTAAPEHKLNQDGKVILWINPEKPDDYRLPEEELCVMLLAVIAGGVIGVIGALLLAAA
ncbi:MAG: DUF3592 domain-containing protein [Oscillospiraceae bacterium]|nr:DUF3592 domain-containing protein [Oscillospiraceae bacterium]